jgi:hypothetical protein
MVNMAKEKEEFLCKFNLGIGCDEYDKCGNCGWNPEVNAKRKRLANEAYGLDEGGEQHE